MFSKMLLEGTPQNYLKKYCCVLYEQEVDLTVHKEGGDD